MEEFSRELPDLSGAAVRALPSDLTEREEIDLLCQVETYMNVTDKHSQTHPAAGAEEARIYSLVNSLIAKRFSDIGAAVRGEAVAKSESVERTKALEEFYKASICWEGVCGHPDATFDDERRAEERFIAAGKAMRELPISARAADAPSEPSETLYQFRARALPGRGLSEWTGWELCCKGAHDELALNADYQVRSFGLLKSRAADALDSQPTGLPTFHATQVENIELALAQELDDAALSANDYVTVNREKLRGIAERILAAAKLELSSQPTDGGVRNG